MIDKGYFTWITWWWWNRIYLCKQASRRKHKHNESAKKKT